MSSSVKVKVQSFGRFLSNMVMPNIGAFIAWGIITALFIPTGWLPNETLAKLVGPMITYLLPLLIGYTGGRLVGGDRGTAGAIRMTAEAALRAGAGLVRALTHKDNIVPILAARPEIMVDELTDEALQQALGWADMIVVGPGLGQKEWGKKALRKIENSQKPMLWDADALNLLAFNPDKRQNRIITPHPGEAARLLNLSTAEIESDRLLAAQRLVKRYGGVAVLKGAGTIIASESGEIAFADVGNAGMASGGMGDVLSGIIGALCGQKLTLYDAACAGCVVHGAAADAVAARFGTRGMLATDLFSELFRFVNPEMLNNKA
ncbi:MAG: NAD(P)H-hydrate dehydratase [Mixta calida]|nr:NAD(P)H-hydrate dehydratase [Mixta calida]